MQEIKNNNQFPILHKTILHLVMKYMCNKAFIAKRTSFAFAVATRVLHTIF